MDNQELAGIQETDVEFKDGNPGLDAKLEIAMLFLLKRELSSTDLSVLTGLTRRTISKVRGHIFKGCPAPAALKRFTDLGLEKIEEISKSEMALSRELNLTEKRTTQRARDEWYNATSHLQKQLKIEEVIFVDQDIIEKAKAKFIDDAMNLLACDGNTERYNESIKSEEFKSIIRHELACKNILQKQKITVELAKERLTMAMRAGYAAGVKGIFNKQHAELKRMQETRRTRYASKRANKNAFTNNKAAVQDSIITAQERKSA